MIPLAILAGGIVAMWLFCEAAVRWIVRDEARRVVVVVVLPDPDEVYDQEADEALIALRADLNAWGRA